MLHNITLTQNYIPKRATKLHLLLQVILQHSYNKEPISLKAK
jgi:hypothetical protein